MRAVVIIALVSLAGCERPPYRHVHEARALIAANCAACHQVPGVRTATGTVGPPLAGIARRQVLAGHFPNTRDNMIRWIGQPQAMLPGNAMPDMGLSPRQAAIIADYLYTMDKRS